MSHLSYQSPVAMPIVESTPEDDYRIYRPNRKWLVSVLVNGQRYYYRTYVHWVTEKTYCNASTLTPNIVEAHPHDTFPRARHVAGMYLTEPTGNGFEMRASAETIRKILSLDIKPRVKIEIAMVETTIDEPAWRKVAYMMSGLAHNWHTQYWTDL